jgi:hypothetical protein
MTSFYNIGMYGQDEKFHTELLRSLRDINGSTYILDAKVIVGDSALFA